MIFMRFRGPQALNDKKGNLVARMTFPFIELPSKHPKYIERPMRKRAEELPRAGAGAVGANETPEQKLTLQEVKQDRERQLTRSGPSQEHFFE
ncbi:MAG TPA: hypothetical protein VNE63_20150 [Candidatus Acidoferrales bacterium]|nr:hypothetical protein [Candidatus Acidoferrales bacterium]